MKVLIADDSPLSQKILQTHLQRWGYESITVSDGQAAWLMLQQPDAPALVIMDWMMPEMDGIEVCRRLRAAKHEPYIYIILLTGRDDRADIVSGLDAGADDYIVKPFDTHELNVRLRAGKRIVDLQSELIAARERLRIEASTDTLTGLSNRNAILKVMHRDALRAQREGTHLAVALLDIDHFKKVNDTFGHKAGDHVLRHVAESMHGLLRPYDALARWGGEEFLLFLPNCSRADALHVADRLRMAVAASHVPVASNQSVRVTCSLGVAAWEGGLEPLAIEGLIEVADAALYRAKANGRDRVES